MTEDIRTSTPETGSTPRTTGWPLIAAALGFVLCYLSVGPLTSSLTSEPRPLPNAAAADLKAWAADNPLAIAVTATLQLLSVGCLAIFVLRLGRSARPEPPRSGIGPTVWGLFAVGAMLLSCVLAWLLAALAPGASELEVSVLRTGSFIAGGAIHVGFLGGFVWLASKVYRLSKPVRVLAYIAFVPAALCLISLFWFQGAALILLGRLLCMIWTICAAISITRRLAAARRLPASTGIAGSAD